LPIHSFVINRFVVPAESIATDETLNRLEDHYLLLRLSFVAEFSLAKLSQPVCQYRIFNGVFSGDREKYLEARDSDIDSWKKSKEKIQTVLSNASAIVKVSQLRKDLQERVELECQRTEERVQAQSQRQMALLTDSVNELEEQNLELSQQVRDWQSSNKKLGALLDQQNAELSRFPYKIIRLILSSLSSLSRWLSKDWKFGD
jgi:hypothetical protein